MKYYVTLIQLQAHCDTFIQNSFLYIYNKKWLDMSGCNGICLMLLVNSMSILCLLSYVTYFFFTECKVICSCRKIFLPGSVWVQEKIFCFFIIYALQKLHMQYQSFPDTITRYIFLLIMEKHETQQRWWKLIYI